MSEFPTEIAGSHYDDLAHLARSLERLARQRAVANPGQRHTAEMFERLPADQRTLVGRAASVLIAQADHADVLLFCAMVGKWDRDSWEPALLDRLESGAPIPDGPGTQGMTLVEELTETFAWGPLSAATKARAAAVLGDKAPASSLIQFLAVHGTAVELSAALEEALEAEPVPVEMVTYGVGRLAGKDANQVPLLIPSLAGLPKAVREGIDATVKIYAKDWYAASGDVLRRGLGLP